MKIVVNEQFKKFWLIYEGGWKSFYGHEIQVGDYHFAIGGQDRGILISEINTGAKIKHIPMNPFLLILTISRDDTLEFYRENLVPILVELVQLDTFKLEMEIISKKVSEKYPQRPPIENVDDIMIRVSVSDILN